MTNKLWPYFLWIPLSILYNVLMCWASIKFGNKEFVKMWFAMFMFGVVPSWSLASYFSHNLIFDALIFDTTLVLSSPIIFWFLGQGQNFTFISWTGVLLTIVGLTVTRLSMKH